MLHKVFTAARDAVATPREGHVFHMNSVTFARVLCATLLVITLPFFVLIGIMVLAKGGNAAALIECVSVLGCALLFEIILVVLMSWMYPVRVGDDGVSATDFWGRRLTLSWGEIETVTPMRFMNLPYLKVASFRKDRAVLWLPLFVRKPDALRNAILHSASAKNPLRRFVENDPAVRRQPLIQ